MLLFLSAPARAVSGWFDASFRRPIDVIWDAEHAGGGELCYVEFYTGGHCNPDLSDLRVATDEGRQTPAKVLRVGPGDRVSCIFSLVRGVRKYYAYFGDPTPPPVRPGFDDVKIEAGLLLDMRALNAGPVENERQAAEAWNNAGPSIGRTMIDAPFYGINPFGPQNRWISRISGSLFAPLDGNYTFAVYADSRGSLSIDGNPVVFATAGPADVRNQAKIQLKRGRHDFLFYHVNLGTDGRFTVAWQRPDSKGFEVIPRGSFGIYMRGIVGPLEELHKLIVADEEIQYGGECYYADAYSHRYKFAAAEPNAAVRATYRWDFGDGQTADAAKVEHVYLADGIYPVKLTVTVGASSDSIVNRLAVSRDWAHIDKPPGDEPGVQSKIVAEYDVEKMPEDWLPRAVLLHERAGDSAAMLAAANRLAALPKHASADAAFAALAAASKAAADKGDPQSAVKLWERVPQNSDVQPRAAAAFAQTLLWQMADFDRAVAVLRPFADSGNPRVRRLLADALILDQKAEQGRKIFDALPVAEDSGRRLARSGAMARTIEYYIAEKDVETGEEQWEQWQDQFPQEFLEGYGVVLKTRLMELRNASAPAAKAAEAFALAVPDSSYAPQLLSSAAKMLGATDPAHAQAIIKLLKERYPEDPLSQ